MKTKSFFSAGIRKLFFASKANLSVLLLLGAALLAPLTSRGQAHLDVSGIVTDDKSGDLVPYANAALLRPADSLFLRGATSDFDGHFVIHDVDTGRYLLRVTFVGYDDLYRPVRVLYATTLDTVRLHMGGTLLEAVSVTAKRPVYAMDGEKNLYQVSDDPGVQTGNATDALRKAPGVEVDAQGNISLRGVSSVDVWINDHPSNLNEEALRTYIKQLPANSIERIEVITNPSARYSSKSGGGIINIITNTKVKRNEFVSFGLNGATMPYVSPWVSYVYANEKISLNLYAAFSYYQSFYTSVTSSTTLGADGQAAETLRDSTHVKARGLSSYFNANFDYNIDSMNTLSTWLGMGPGSSLQNVFVGNTRNDLTSGNRYSHVMRSDLAQPTLFAYAGAWYEHKFNDKGHRLTANFSGNLYGGNSPNSISRVYSDYPGMNYDLDFDQSMSMSSYDLQLDYTVPYSKNGEIQIGIDEAQSFNHTNAVIRDSTAALGAYLTDSVRSRIDHAANHSLDGYVTLQHRFGNFTVKGGLRAEYDHVGATFTGTSQTGADVDKDYFNLRPSLHLSYRTESLHNFSLSYSRHISAPEASQLTTFRDYELLQDVFATGNPSLQESYTNSFEAGWTKYFPKFGSVGLQLYHKNSQREIGTLTDVMFSDYFGRVVAYTQDVNLGDTYNTGAELNLTYRPQDFMSVTLYANLFNYKYNVRYNGKPYSDEKTAYSLRLAFYGKLWKKVDLFASANYQSPTIGLFSQTLSTYSIDGGLSADFFDRKLSAYLSVQDLFNWQRMGSNVSNPTYSSTNTQRYTSRYVALGITMRLGKMELESKAKQGGNTGAGNAGAAGGTGVSL